jgi:hypothetical protein
VRRLLNAAPPSLSGTVVYDAIIDAIYGFAYRLTKLIQGGPMAPQAAVTLVAGAAVVLFAWLQLDVAHLPAFTAR